MPLRKKGGHTTISHCSDEVWRQGRGMEYHDCVRKLHHNKSAQIGIIVQVSSLGGTEGVRQCVRGWTCFRNGVIVRAHFGFSVLQCATQTTQTPAQC